MDGSCASRSSRRRRSSLPDDRAHRAALTDRLRRLTRPCPWTLPGRSVAVIGAALDLGSGPARRRHGAVGDPLRGARRAARRARHRVRDRGNVEHARCREATRQGDAAPALPRARSSRPASEIADRVARAVEEGEMPLVLGGDHSIALGTLGGLAARTRGPAACSGSTRTPTSTRPRRPRPGNVHGMPLAVALGRRAGRRSRACWPLPAVDARPGRAGRHPRARPGRARAARRARRVSVFTMSRPRPAWGRGGDARRRSSACSGGRRSSTSRSTWTSSTPSGRRVSARRCAAGSRYREAHLAMELVAEAGLLTSLEIVEVNPMLDDGEPDRRAWRSSCSPQPLGGARDPGSGASSPFARTARSTSGPSARPGGSRPRSPPGRRAGRRSPAPWPSFFAPG